MNVLHQKRLNNIKRKFAQRIHKLVKLINNLTTPTRLLVYKKIVLPAPVVEYIVLLLTICNKYKIEKFIVVFINLLS